MKLMILDGNSIVNRTFYGIRMLNTPDGTPINGVYGFLTVLRKLIEEEKPQALCVAFDLKAPTFRHLQFEAYKAQRKAMPEELAVQIPILKEVLDSLGIKRLELEGFEADDIIGTVSRICNDKGWECTIVTGDKDSFQLITETTHVRHIKSRMGKTETTEYTPEMFKEEYGFEPKRIIDLKALMGDSSDNIPGVRGVGEKTAMELVRSYGTIEKIYSELDSLDIKDSVKAKLADGKSDAEMSFYLATIDTNVPVDFSPEGCAFSGDYSDGYAIFKKLGFNSLIEKWGVTEKAGNTVSAKPSSLPIVDVVDGKTLQELSDTIRSPYVAVLPLDGGLDALELCDGNAVFILRWANLGDKYNSFLKELFSQQVHKLSHNNKDFMGRLMSENLD
ncbi:MAG: 5'-3' exonuclease H3TH domain-containing protein, partial [Oscillospiraceae bacterium]